VHCRGVLCLELLCSSETLAQASELFLEEVGEANQDDPMSLEARDLLIWPCQSH
jgi:hypothetical protein